MKGQRMRIALNATIAAAALVLTVAPILLAADPVTQCGAAQLKVFSAYLKGVVTEGGNACGAGSSGHPQPVDATKLAALTDKVNADFQAAIDKFGDANCFQKPTAAAADTIVAAQRLADELCLVPTPTPTSTP